MEEFCKTFMDCQDSQIEGLLKVLQDFKEKYKKQDERLRSEYGNYSNLFEKTKNEHSQIAEQVKVVFGQIDEYSRVVERMERAVENAERDLQALEEYCHMEKLN